MKIGLIDVDGHNFPNIALMKLSAWHKKKGDLVKWYNHLFDIFEEPYDVVYMSKIFSFTPNYEYEINAKQIIKGGSGYCIEVIDGVEVYKKENDTQLSYEIEHIYPDYSIYFEKVPETKNTAYGYLSRGCPRGCDFCIVKDREGIKTHKVADLSEWWNGQKYIELCDANPIACKEWRDILTQLKESKAYVNFNQGIDVRIMTEQKAELIKQIKVKSVHIAWDKYEEKEVILPKIRLFKEITQYDRRKLICYVLCGYNTSFEQDLERIYTLREIGIDPYVMLYNKNNIPKHSNLKKIQRWVNNRYIWGKIDNFEEYLKGE